MKPLQRLAPDWQLLSRLLDEALALLPHEREAWLAGLAPEAAHLQPQLRDLLEVQQEVETGTFLEELPMLPGLREATAGVQPGDHVGPYRIVGELGRGGMGTVWLAERADGQLKRRCALKLPAFAWSDTLRERMAQERDILASLDHPHIARLLDAGVDEQGRPFLALEHVQGEAIDRWADRKLLAVRARVELFVQVVDAIRYAHANLVIHRDLKPSNILVTEAGRCKLLDFGIAKLMSDAQAAEQAVPVADLTLTGQRLLTPRYASPEQVLGQRLTAASDVYSLGVVLYELLCGRAPYDAGDRSRPLLEQAILDGRVRAASRQPADEETSRVRGATPARLARQLRGELDAILLRTLGRQPQERYPSAEALQADLRAWLENRPIQARKPGALATAWKFVRRHRWPVAIGSAGVVATVAMAMVAAGLAWRSEKEALRAGAARDVVEEMLKGTDPSLRQGRPLTQRELLERVESTVGARYAAQPELRERVYQRLADLWSELDEQERRLAMLERRAALLAQLGNPREQVNVLVEQARIALGVLRDVDRADLLLRRVESLARTTALDPTVRIEHELWRGWVEERREGLEAAHAAFARAEALASETGAGYQLARVLRARARTAFLLGWWEDSDQAFARAVELVGRLGHEWPAADRRAANWELANDMLLRGEYAVGWKAVQDLTQSDAQQYGRFAPANGRLHRLWLEWCVTMRQERLAARWLREREQSPGETQTGEPEAEWLLAEAQIRALTGEARRADELLARAERAVQTSPSEEVRTPRLLRLAGIRVRLAAEKRSVPELDETIEALRRTDNAPGAKPGSWSRRTAVALADRAHAWRARIAGPGPDTITALVRSVRSTEALLGPRHPQVWAMRLNLALERWAASPQGVHADDAERAARALVAHLPVEHPTSLAAMTVIRDVEAWKSNPATRSGKPRLPRAARALILL